MTRTARCTLGTLGTPTLARGFTLIETLVALAIVAIALAAGVRATAALQNNAERQANVLLAQLCAENTLIALRLSHQLPGVGDTTAPCEQANRRLSVLTAVRPTPNPNFLRVEAQVSFEALPVLQVTTILGRY
jgi:general secretion pathway protein I